VGLVATAAMASTAAARSPAHVIPALDARLMLSARFVAGIAYMALAVTGFVALEMVERLGTTRGNGPTVAKTWIVAVVYMTIEAARSMEPGACADEQAADEPVRPIVAVRGTIIRRVIGHTGATPIPMEIWAGATDAEVKNVAAIARTAKSFT
jgi:hypothetical protein